MYMDLPANTHFVLGPQSIKNQDIKTEWIKYKNGYTVSTNKFGFMTKYPIDKYPVKR